MAPGCMFKMPFIFLSTLISNISRVDRIRIESNTNTWGLLANRIEYESNTFQSNRIRIEYLRVQSKSNTNRILSHWNRIPIEYLGSPIEYQSNTWAAQSNTNRILGTSVEYQMSTNQISLQGGLHCLVSWLNDLRGWRSCLAWLAG